MKKIKLFLVIAMIFSLSSCVPSEEVAGTYNGYWTPTGSSPYVATLVINKSDNSHVNMNLTVSGTVVALNVNVTSSGNKVIFSYSSSTTTYGAPTSISGNVNNKKATMDYSVNGIGSTITGQFVGSKP